MPLIAMPHQYPYERPLSSIPFLASLTNTHTGEPMMTKALYSKYMSAPIPGRFCPDETIRQKVSNLNANLLLSLCARNATSEMQMTRCPMFAPMSTVVGKQHGGRAAAA